MSKKCKIKYSHLEIYFYLEKLGLIRKKKLKSHKLPNNLTKSYSSEIQL